MKNGMKKSNKIIVAIIIVLALVVAISAILMNQNRDAEGGHLSVVTAEDTLAEYSIDEIKKMPSIEVEKELVSGSKEPEKGVFTGVPLENLLAELDPDWESKYNEFIFTASDGFSSAVAKSDVLEGENVLVVYEKDGEALDKESGPLRIIIVNDPFGNRSTFNLNKIELK